MRQCIGIVILVAATACMAACDEKLSTLAGPSPNLEPTFASVQTTTPPHLRAQAAAITFMISNMIAIGIGPTVVGVMSDLLKPSMGADSLRYALVVIANLSVFGAIAAYFAGKSMRRDAAISAAA